MKNYLVEIKIQIPYPKTFSYRENGSSFGTAIGRSIKKMRTELNKKKVGEIIVKAKKI
jgi:hypothetical protein